jgi:hypothetical protein
MSDWIVERVEREVRRRSLARTQRKDGAGHTLERT